MKFAPFYALLVITWTVAMAQPKDQVPKTASEAASVHGVVTPAKGASLVLHNCTTILDKCGQSSFFSVPNCVSSAMKYGSASGYGKDADKNSKYFGKEIQEIRNDKTVDYFLQDLETRLKNPKPFNLWTFARENRWIRNKKDPKASAIKLLAVVFSRDKVSTDGWDPKQHRQIQSLLDHLYSRVHNNSLEALPPPMKSEGRPFYHFYANAYLANQLLHEHQTSLSYAAAAVWSVNQTYEEHERVDLPNLPAHAKRDVYAGYAAVAFAFTADNLTYTGPTYEDFDNEVKTGKVPASFINRIAGFCKDGWQKLEGPIHFDRKLLTEPPELPAATSEN